jgi:hypothetical protein
MADVVHRRRSTKAFAATPVPEETLAELLRRMQVRLRYSIVDCSACFLTRLLDCSARAVRLQHAAVRVRGRARAGRPRPPG